MIKFTLLGLINIFGKDYFYLAQVNGNIFLFTLPKIFKKLITFFRYKDDINDNEKWINCKLLKNNPAFSSAIFLSPAFKDRFKSIKLSFSLVKKISLQLNKDRFSLPIKGIDSTGYILDSLQRFVPNFKIHKLSSPLVFVCSWLYVFNIINYLNWLEKFAEKNKFDSVLINHQFYMESGFISYYLNKKFKTNIIHFSVKNKYPVFVEPRVKWFKKILDKKLFESLSTNEMIKNEKKKFTPSNTCVV